ncbi:MAG: hypothetical protein EHM77_03865 [Planctomycetaceae bacterium]|nr:MAG: hypothetical protein EHM77_03865 [Planctomycetaceae bacterium]
MKYCGRNFSDSQIKMICQLIAENPLANRIKLSRMLCEFFGWLRPDGKLKEMSCRVAMIRMHNDGLNVIDLRHKIPPFEKGGPGGISLKRLEEMNWK